MDTAARPVPEGASGASMRAERWLQHKGCNPNELLVIVSQPWGAPHPPASVNPCKGGGRIGKCCKRASKTANSAENNRAEQRENRNPGPETRDYHVSLSCSLLMGTRLHARLGRPTCPLTLLKFHAFSSAENDTLFHNEKPGAISARAFCTALDVGLLYTNHVTLSTNVEL